MNIDYSEWKASGLSQAEIARHIGVHPLRVNRAVNGAHCLTADEHAEAMRVIRIGRRLVQEKAHLLATV